MRMNHRQQTFEQAEMTTVGSTLSDEVIASSGVSFHIWRLYQHAWLVCLAFPMINLVGNPITPWHVVLGLLALSGFAAGYTWLMWPHPASSEARSRSHSWFSLLLFGLLSALSFTLSLTYGPAWLWLFIGTSALAGLLLPMRGAFIVIVAFTLLPMFLTLPMYGGVDKVDWWWLIALMLLIRGLGLDMIGVARMGNAIRRLNFARTELARMAIIEERLRLSRDLHDLLGQTLSVITLKSELARGLVTEAPERCALELEEIERVSRQMLREVRKTVAGYRQPTLATELDGARQLLEAAGITYVLDQTVGNLPPPIDTVLAWTIREGVTNVIRHSRAHHCLIRLTRQQEKQDGVCTEIINDCKQVEKLPGDFQAGPSDQGSGLSGLRERVAALGGMLSVESLTLSNMPHFRLCVKIPLEALALSHHETAGIKEE